MTSVLIVDDLHSIREFLKINLSGEPDLQIVGVANDGEMAVSKAWEFQPDIVLMDINMPGDIDGIQATGRIASRSPEIKVLLLTSEDNKAQLDRALEAGARGYILKNTGIKDIANVIRLAEKGFFQIGPILSNWDGTLHNKVQLDIAKARTSGLLKENSNPVQLELDASTSIQSSAETKSETKQAISDLSSELFQLQQTIKTQEDTINNLTNQYSEVQQEIKDNLKRSPSLFFNPASAKRVFRRPWSRSQKRQNFLFISSFFLGIVTVLVLTLIFAFLGGA